MATTITPDLLTIREAASRLGIDAKTLHYHIGRGALAAIELPGYGKRHHQRIAAEEVERFRAKREK